MHLEVNEILVIANETTGERCSGEVRWHWPPFDGECRLQQKFIITEYVNGSVVAQREEWRFVPVVKE